MMLAIGIILSLVFIGWLIFMAIKKRPIKAYMVLYTLSWLTGIFAIAYFLNMDLDLMLKVLASIIVGALLIILAARLQRARPEQPPK